MKAMATTALGMLVMTCGVAEVIDKDINFAKFVTESVERFMKQDWGDTCAEDWELNDLGFRDSDSYGRILASYDYKPNNNYDLWIIRESDCSSTTILFPNEY
jgi:hypothetical protein